MRGARVVAGLVVTVGLAVGVDALSDATQNRPDDVESGTRSTVVFDLALRDHGRSEAAAAQTLWSVCSTTVDHATTIRGPVAQGDAWEVVVAPALGEHSRRRLVGCLEDATIDGVLARVVDLTPHPA
jgi:hypothetical protein